MLIVVLKVVMAPLLVGAGSFVQRRWGQSVGGRVVGLPLTSLPLLLLLTLSDGRSFAGTAATAMLGAGVAQAGWCLTYAVAALHRGPAASLAWATAVFGVLCVVLFRFPMPPLLAVIASTASIVGALWVWPDGPAAGPARTPGRLDLPARMAAAAIFAFAVAGSASVVGPRVAGLLGALPVLTLVLAYGTHRRDGSAAVGQFLDGVMEGSLSVVAALAVLAGTLATAGPLVAFPLAVMGSLAAQFVPVRYLGRPHLTLLRRRTA